MTQADPTLALRAANRRGIAAMSVAMAAFVANDAIVKYVSQSAGALQLIFVRGAFACILLLGVAHALGATRQWRALADRRVALRSVIDTAGTLTYLVGLFHMPLANATAINMAMPLFVTLMAVLLLRERVGAARWLAMAAGFTGVLLVIQPSGAGFNVFALLCLVGTIGGAGRDFVTRLISPGIPSVLITLSTTLVITAVTGSAVAVQGWQPMAWANVALLATASVFLSCAYYLLITAMRGGEMSVIAPFRYAGLLFALLLGYIVWGDVPNALAWAGIALLVGAGLHVLHGERRKRRLELEAATD